MTNSITHASHSSFGTVIKPSSTKASEQPQGFAALLEAAQMPGASPMMQTGTLEPSLSLYLQHSEQSIGAEKLNETQPSNQIEMQQTSAVNINDSVWKIG